MYLSECHVCIGAEILSLKVSIKSVHGVSEPKFHSVILQPWLFPGDMFNTNIWLLASSSQLGSSWSLEIKLSLVEKLSGGPETRKKARPFHELSPVTFDQACCLHWELTSWVAYISDSRPQGTRITWRGFLWIQRLLGLTSYDKIPVGTCLVAQCLTTCLPSRGHRLDPGLGVFHSPQDN